MSQTCAISTCDVTSLTTCICCNQSLCREHFLEHDYLLRPKLNDLTERINTLIHQFECLDVNKVTHDSLAKVAQWRLDSYKVVDKFYEKKCLELNQFISDRLNKQERDIHDLKFKLAKMINVQQTTKSNIELLTTKIMTLQLQMNEIHEISSQMDIRPLVILDKLIDVDLSNLHQVDQAKLSSPHQTIDRMPLSSNAMASNGEHLLIHQNSNLYLIDTNLSVICQRKWSDDSIRDMCWSHVLNCFFLITSNKIYRANGNTLRLEHVNTIDGRFWQSCTCSNTSLYLSQEVWNSSLAEFSLEPSIGFVKHYQRKEALGHRQRIDSIEYRNEKLILAINNQSKEEIYIELRSVGTFDQLWLCRLTTEYSERKIQCCLYTHNTWLVADWGTSSLFHLAEDGKMKKIIEYDYGIYYISLCASNKLVISTDHSIHFHQL